MQGIHKTASSILLTDLLLLTLNGINRFYANMHYLFPLFFFLGALVFSLSTASMCFTGRPYSSASAYVDGKEGEGGVGTVYTYNTILW